MLLAKLLRQQFARAYLEDALPGLECDDGEDGHFEMCAWLKKGKLPYMACHGVVAAAFTLELGR